MRLIDADALERRVYTGWLNGELSNSEWIDFREWLKDAPTVEPASTWRMVEDELPKIGKTVLVYDDLDRLSICQLDNRYRWFRQGGGWIDVPYARYWMPISEPPKEEA